MPQMGTTELFQLIAWIFALIELIMGLYILILNFRNNANRHVSVLLLLIAVNTFAQGFMLTAEELRHIQLPVLLLAATTPAIQPALLLVSVLLLKPDWLRGRWKVFWWAVYGMVALPVILTLVDYFFQTSIWFTGYHSDTYSGGFVNMQYFTEGFLGVPIRIIFIYVITIVTIFPILYIAFFDKSTKKITRNLAYLLLTTQVFAVAVSFIIFFTVASYYAVLATSIIFAVGYTYAAFWQLISERRMQSGRVQYRITTGILAISIPIMVALSLFVSWRARDLISQNAVKRLEETNDSIASTVTTWLDLNEKALEFMVKMPGITNMDPESQKPILQKMAETYEYMYLVSTLDQYGLNVARSDDVELKDYSDRFYYQSIIGGMDVAEQTLIGKTSGQPALVIAKPIKNEDGELVGVGFYASTLDAISTAIEIGNIGTTGKAFIIDSNNQVIAHTDPQFTSGELQDFSQNPAVASMRQGAPGNIFRNVSDEGVLQVTYYQELDNGWGVIIQQEEADFLETFSVLETIVPIVVIIGVILLGALTTLAIRQGIHPIVTLTDTVTAISQGDLTRTAPVESEDEFGVLAKSFNQMTEQLRVSISNLEIRVEDRTKDLEERSLQLQAAAEVGRAASSVLDIDQLIQEVVGMIRERFDLYYVGLFIVGETREWAYLRAGTGDAGRAMLARGHRIEVGQGMIGWSIANGRPRIALEAGEDAVRLATPELPETRSEAAIPLQVRGQVIGAISVQDKQVGSFDEISISTLQTMADLVSVAIDNARLFSESQAALETSQRLFGEMSTQSWRKQTQTNLGYRSNDRGTFPISSIGPEPAENEVSSELKPISIPIKIRDAVIGELNSSKLGDWHSEELSIIEALAEQIGVALEEASLFQETQRRASFEQLTREVTTRMRETLNLESVVQIAATEFRKALDLSEVEIRMGITED